MLVNTGEYRAPGGHPDGAAARTHRDGERLLETTVQLRHLALATSSPLGTAFDAKGRWATSCILTGRPRAPTWRPISVTGPSAALADALSKTRAEIESVLHSFADYRLHLG